MFLWISGFLKGDDEDDSLKFNLNVAREHEAAVMDTIGWKSLDESADGEWLLTGAQTQQLNQILGEELPKDLDLFISVRD